MSTARLGLGARLLMALVLPWRLLLDGALAARLRAALAAPAPEALGTPTPSPVLEVEPEAPAEPEARDLTPALQLLSILQREGRFVDFLQEDVTEFSDADIGGAARVIHEGCNKALRDYLRLEPVRAEGEGAPVVLEPGFDPLRNRVTGNVVGEPPFRGHLAHPGWRVASISLPALAEGHDAYIVAPAEIEL